LLEERTRLAEKTDIHDNDVELFEVDNDTCVAECYRPSTLDNGHKLQKPEKTAKNNVLLICSEELERRKRFYFHYLNILMRVPIVMEISSTCNSITMTL